jgi:hypothetical protein
LELFELKLLDPLGFKILWFENAMKSVSDFTSKKQEIICGLPYKQGPDGGLADVEERITCISQTKCVHGVSLRPKYFGRFISKSLFFLNALWLIYL